MINYSIRGSCHYVLGWKCPGGVTRWGTEPRMCNWIGRSTTQEKGGRRRGYGKPYSLRTTKVVVVLSARPVVEGKDVPEEGSISLEVLPSFTLHRYYPEWTMDLTSIHSPGVPDLTDDLYSNTTIDPRHCRGRNRPGFLQDLANTDGDD